VHVSFAFTVYGVQTKELGMHSMPDNGKLLQNACRELDFRRSYELMP
jgi:hypothetical protein